MTDTANAPGPHEPDYKTAMLYHSDRADAYMGERDALTAELAKLRADLAEAQAKIARLTEATDMAINRLELRCDEAWNGDARDFKRSLVGVFAEYRAALQENANG